MLSNSALNLVSGKSYSEVGIILEVNNEVAVKAWMAKDTNTSLHVSQILYSTLLRRNISSKVEPSFVEDIKMAAGFRGVPCEYVWWLIFMYKVTLKIKFDVLFEEGVVL